MTKKKLGPVELNVKIDDCMDCPFCDADETYTACMMNDGPSHLPVYRRDDQIITPPKDCPLRKIAGKKLKAEECQWG